MSVWITAPLHDLLSSGLQLASSLHMDGHAGWGHRTQRGNMDSRIHGVWVCLRCPHPSVRGFLGPGLPAPSCPFIDVDWEGTKIPRDMKLADSEPLQRSPLIPKSQDHGYRAPKLLIGGGTGDLNTSLMATDILGFCCPISRACH